MKGFKISFLFFAIFILMAQYLVADTATTNIVNNQEELDINTLSDEHKSNIKKILDSIKSTNTLTSEIGQLLSVKVFKIVEGSKTTYTYSIVLVNKDSQYSFASGTIVIDANSQSISTSYSTLQ